MFTKWSRIFEIYENLAKTTERLTKENEMLRTRYNDMMAKFHIKEKYENCELYIVVFKNEDALELYVSQKDKANRPNNMEDEELINKYVTYNYGTYKEYEIIKVGANRQDFIL